MPRVYVTKLFGFEAAHHLVGYDGPCANIHGHSYKLEVTVSGVIDNHVSLIASENMVIDFKELKKIVKDCVLRTHDHVDLNTLYDNPTAEVMAVSMFYKIQEHLPRDVRMEKVKLWETADSYAEYRGDM